MYDITAYFLPITRTEHHIRVRFQLLNVSFVLLRVKLYIALPVSIIENYLAQGVLSHVGCMRTYSPRPNS